MDECRVAACGSDDDGDEVYSLSAAALDGLRTVERLTKDRSISLSSHLISGLLRHLRDFAATVSPDVTEYVTYLQPEKARIQAEIDRVVAGGRPDEASDDDIVQGFTDFSGSSTSSPATSPASWSPTASSSPDTITDVPHRAGLLRRGGPPLPRIRPTLSLLGRRPRVRGRPSVAARPGVAGPGQPVHRHPAGVASRHRPVVRRGTQPVRNTVMLIRDGLKRVLEHVPRSHGPFTTTSPRTTSNATTNSPRHSGCSKPRLATWMQTAGPRAKAPLPLLPGKPDIEHLRTKMYDPADDEPPLPLADLAAPAALGGLSLAELRARGGPSHALLRDELAANFDTDGGVESLAASSTPSPSTFAGRSRFSACFRSRDPRP